MNGVSHTLPPGLGIPSCKVTQQTYHSPHSSSFTLFLTTPSMITFTKDLIQSTEIFLYLGKTARCSRKHGCTAKPLDYTSASNFFIKLFKHSPCNTLDYLGNFLPLLETINCAAFQNKVFLSEQNNKKRKGSGRYLFP